MVWKEFKRYFYSWSGLLVILLFLFVMGTMVWIVPGYTLMEEGVASLDVMFGLAPVLFMFLVPALAMGAISEEYQQRTIQLLLSRPLSVNQIVIAKYISILLILLLALVPTLVYVYSLGTISYPKWVLDWGELAGAYIGLFLLSACFAAVSLLCSSYASNQIEAFVLGAFFCFLLYYGFFFLSQLPVLVGKWDFVCQYLGLDYHYRSMSQGVLTIQDMIYFLSISATALIWTVVRLKSRSVG